MKMKIARTGPLGQIILFGDSITEFSANQERGFAFMPALQNAYMRRFDVINRGFSGYNTNLALNVLPDFMPTLQQASVAIMFVFFGANDACLPSSSTGQHVHLDKFKLNLKQIASHDMVKIHQPTIIFITPPPVDEYAMEVDSLLKGFTEVTRTAEHTKRYADACREVGKELGVAVVDLWTAIMKKAGWQEGDTLPGSKTAPRSPVLGSLLLDGLHFSPQGYEVLFSEVMETMQGVLPEYVPAAVPYRFPYYRDALT